MPNWCECELSVRVDDDHIAELQKFVNDVIGEDEEGKLAPLSFSKLIPEPEEITNTTSPAKEHNQELIDKYAASDWYHWRNEFKVYCKDHISLAPKGATIFTITKVDNIDVNMEWLYKNKNVDEIEVGWSCAIYGPDVGDKLGVCPNLASDMSEQIIE